jgi:toxin ParE1/3/4
MNYSVSILAEAELDIDNAYIWYELAQIDLGNKFYKKVNESISFISNNPFACQVIYKGIRRFVLKKFPYGIYYKVLFEQKEVQIVGILHFKRNPKLIQKRI